MRPIIGVSSNFGLDKQSDPPRRQSYLLATYTDAIFAAGGIAMPLPVPPEHDEDLIDEMLSAVNGLLFTGGLDLHPRHWDAALHSTTKPLHPRRDGFELDLFSRADARRLPILAICLGFQVAHVARGGQLCQHVDDLNLTPATTHHLPHERSAFHNVRIAPQSSLAAVVGTTEIEVNSRHHQVVPVEHQGTGLQPVAHAPDGVLEASEDCDGRFLLAVQWHPEELCDRPEHLRLFEALVAAAQTQ